MGNATDRSSRPPPTAGARPILLAHSYFLGYDEKQWRKMKPYAPLATLTAASWVRRHGFDVRLFDAMLSEGVEDFVATLEAVEPRFVAILEDNFNFVTKMCTLRMRRAALDMIEAARARGCRIVVNGSDAVDHPDLYLAAGAHAVIVGEVEGTLLELLRRWQGDADADLTAVAGLSIRGGAPPAGDGRSPPVAGRSGQGAHRVSQAVEADRGRPRVLPLAGAPAGVVETGSRARIEDLDDLPFPAWDLVDTDQYRAAWREAHGRFSWSMVTSRGCPYGCNWCAKPVFGRRYSQRSPADVAEELARLRAEVGPDHVWFCDDIFGLTAEWIEEFAREVDARGARTPFLMQSRVNLMQPRTVAALAAAGAEEVWLGVESGSQRILDAMDKGSTVKQARDATRNLRAEGVRACWFVQLGYLGEEREDLERTRSLILEERPDEIGVSVSYPLPGTPFYDRVSAQLDGKRNWEQSDDLEMLFHGTYTTEFYRRARDVLHADVDTMNAGDEPSHDTWKALWAGAAGHRNPSALTA